MGQFKRQAKTRLLVKRPLEPRQPLLTQVKTIKSQNVIVKMKLLEPRLQVVLPRMIAKPPDIIVKVKFLESLEVSPRNPGNLGKQFRKFEN